MKEKKGGFIRRWLRWPSITIDLRRPEHRRKLLLFALLFAVVGVAFIFSGYKSYEYTESPEFCGTTCHPMGPEFVRYEKSPHANVECVQCHIGPGASFFVKSKIDGLRQVYAVLVDSFPRPIAGPVHNLRPARETCETCHTPTLFKDNIIKSILHYSDDESNTPIQATFILKLGGWNEGAGISKGIHWHISNPVYYIPADERRQVISWVGVEQADGSLKEYYSRDMFVVANSSFVEDARKNGTLRLMDCIDCHNRTAHEIPPPDRLVDDAIAAGLISRDIPFIRKKAIEVLTPRYSSLVEAYEKIDGLAEFYQVGYPGFYQTGQAKLFAALTELKNIYHESNFPEMKLNWETNPNNQRHTPFPGCFRCHDGKHVSVDETGKEVETISVKCNLCHTVPIVGKGDEMLVEAPVIIGKVPETHSDFRWTIEHRTVTKAEEQECFQCHGQGFCSNEACHQVSHPPDMLFTHPEEYKKQGGQVCYTCHQNVLCSRCHPGGIVESP